ncbi:MAG: NAD(P)H-binding protein [Planctomycetota bacterium]|nr:NAD(P)H-binding protein [Planctomycetota bacterium]
MKVAILGAAGKIGGLTVAEAVAAGHTTIALARNPARIVEPRAPGSTFPGQISRITGDARDPEAVDRAISGVDAVICTFGAPLNWSTLTRQPTICQQATRVLIEVMKKRSIDRLVCLTAIGVGDSRSRGRPIFRSFIRPVLLGRIFADRLKQEELIRASDRRWTIVRPAELTDGPPGPWRTVDASDRAGPEPTFVSRASVAKFLVQEAERSEFLHRSPILADA